MGLEDVKHNPLDFAHNRSPGKGGRRWSLSDLKVPRCEMFPEPRVRLLAVLEAELPQWIDKRSRHGRAKERDAVMPPNVVDRRRHGTAEPRNIPLHSRRKREVDIRLPLRAPRHDSPGDADGGMIDLKKPGEWVGDLAEQASGPLIPQVSESEARGLGVVQRDEISEVAVRGRRAHDLVIRRFWLPVGAKMDRPMFRQDAETCRFQPRIVHAAMKRGNVEGPEVPIAGLAKS